MIVTASNTVTDRHGSVIAGPNVPSGGEVTRKPDPDLLSRAAEFGDCTAVNASHRSAPFPHRSHARARTISSVNMARSFLLFGRGGRLPARNAIIQLCDGLDVAAPRGRQIRGGYEITPPRPFVARGARDRKRSGRSTRSVANASPS